MADPQPESSPPPPPPTPASLPPPALPPLTALVGGGLDKQWIEDAVHRAEDLKLTLASTADDLKQTLATTANSSITTASTLFSCLVAASSDALSNAKGKFEIGKSHYAAAEQEAIWMIKDGIAVAIANPVMSCGVAAGLGLVLLKRPRRALIRNTRRIFLKDESLIANFQEKVKGLEQSVNLMKNESVKLQNRATQAEGEIKRAQSNLKEQGNLIQKELRAANHIERQITDLKDRINELPKREISGFQSKVSAYASEVKQEKKVLNGALSKIINLGIPM